MSKVKAAIRSIHQADHIASQQKWLYMVHPLSKLLVTVLYIAMVLSYNKYDLAGLISMAAYPFVTVISGEVPIRRAVKFTGPLVVLFLLVGIVNPFFDTSFVYQLGTFTVTGGMLSMLTLFLKGLFSMTASYLLFTTTSIEKICYALKLIHVPMIMVTLIMLMYRYIVVLLKEVERVLTAYFLRAPHHRGVHYKAWGPLAGQLLLRSIDRAQTVYESMVLRGYSSSIYVGQKYPFDLKSFLFIMFWIPVIILIRFGIPGDIFINLFKW